MGIEVKSVLICEKIDTSCAELLRENNILVREKYKLTKEELLHECKIHDVVVVRSETKITREILAACSKKAGGCLQIVARAGAGVDNIDVAAATEQDVLVINAPGGNSISACELTCMLIGALARPIVAAGESMKQLKWMREQYKGSELYGKTLAILGLGRIGREVGIRMKAWGMRIIGYDPITTADEALKVGIEKMELEEIWPLADYITVHTPLNADTKNLISAAVLEKCVKGVKVINVARGGIVNETAIYDALNAGKCGGAAFDVFHEEPPSSELTKNLIRHPLVVATPHLGASTIEAQVRVAVDIAEQVLELVGKSSHGKTTSGVVNGEVLKSVQMS